MNQHVKTPLWQHQIEDLEHLKDEDCVLVGNEMGTGKTLLAVERDMRIREADPSHRKTLVVAPLNTHDGWERTYNEETHLQTAVIDAKNRSTFLRTEADVWIMHPEALRLMPELRDFGFTHVIPDECHRFKGRNTKQTKALKQIKVPYKTAMSGSPATDRPHDLWSILNYLHPTQFSGFWKFYNKAVEFEIIYPAGYHKILGPSKWWIEYGLPSIRPYYVRRLKEDIMSYLPPKVPSKVYVELEAKQRRAYDEMAADMLAWVGEHENQPLSAAAVISRLQRLQMLALGYMEYHEELDKFVLTDPSPKCDAALELIEDNEETSFVVFSQFKGPLQLLARRLDKAKIPYGSFTGDDTESQKKEAKASFIRGDARVFLSTIRSGGVGVDGLQHICRTAIFLDRDWSPMINFQAEDRLHRGGSEVHDSIHIIDIMARNTVDAGRHQRIEQKWDWVRRTLGDK
jgi:SNF2 family DNA or RNA helicase